MTVAVVVPWWPTDCPWRNRWRDQVIAYWQVGGFEVVLGEGLEGAARNRGIEACTAEVIVTCDADSVIPYARAYKAIRAAQESPGLVVPHDRYVFLSEAVSARMTASSAIDLMDGDRWTHGGFDLVGNVSVGGPTVFSRYTWAMAGGYDETIVRAYDSAFALACGTLVAEQRRMEGDYLHLYHPRPRDENPPDIWATLREYHKAAEEGPDAMRSLVEERATLRS